MKTTFSILALVSSMAFAVDAMSPIMIDAHPKLIEDWHMFKFHHKKSYESMEDERTRFSIFSTNRLMIDEHNEKFDRGEVTFSMELNEFGDLTVEEFSRKMNGFNRTARLNGMQGGGYYQDSLEGLSFLEPANVQLPNQINWTALGAVTPIKNQGRCGSCWAFSATGALEGQHFRQTGKLVSLSEQNLIDCSGRFGNNGCNGGLMDYAFAYVKVNGGIDTEESYPYEAENDRCRYNPANSGAEDKGYYDLSSGDEAELQSAVATVGPISIAIDAHHNSFQFYRSGVYYEPECSTTKLSHGVLAVGYGTDDNGTDYWLVKNSWGETWGDKGYIKMTRNKNNHCGIATVASYPLV